MQFRPEFYHTLPTPSGEAEEYLYSRGCSEEQIKRYGIRVIPEGTPMPVTAPRGDLLCFPIRDVTGTIHGVQLRSITKKSYSVWSNPGTVECFGLNEASKGMWDKGFVILVEGGFDLFPLERMFKGLVVSTLTAGLSPALHRTLKRWCHRAYLCWDQDPTGVRATERVLSRADESLKFESIAIHKNLGIKDIGALWEKGGDSLVQKIFLETYPALCSSLAPCQ